MKKILPDNLSYIYDNLCVNCEQSLIFRSLVDDLEKKGGLLAV